MTHWLKIDPAVHSEAGCRKFQGFGFAANDHFALVAAAEVAHVLPYYVLVFVQNPSLDRYHLGVVLSLQHGRNVFLADDGRWQAPYIPSHYRGFPFAFDENADFCIDLDSGLFCDPAGPDAQPLYSGGELSETVRRVRDFHEERGKALKTTQALVDQLQAADVLQPWPLRWRSGSQEQVIKGYCGIDEERLRNLSPQTCQKLAHTGALGLAYAQLFSRPRISDLRLRHERQPSPAGETSPPPRHLHAVDTSESLDELFGEGDDELRF